MMPLYSKGGLYKMKKRMIQLMALALVALGVVSGCSAKAQLPTEIGSFAVVDVSMVDTYDTLQAKAVKSSASLHEAQRRHSGG